MEILRIEVSPVLALRGGWRQGWWTVLYGKLLPFCVRYYRILEINRFQIYQIIKKKKKNESRLEEEIEVPDNLSQIISKRNGQQIKLKHFSPYI